MERAVRAYFSRLSLQVRLAFFFSLFFGGFILYFFAVTAVSWSNESGMRRLVEINLPAMELSDKISRSMAAVRSHLTQAALSQSVDELNAAKELDKSIAAEFVKLTELDTAHSQEISDIKSRYETTCKELSALIEELVAGLATIKESKNRVQKYSDTLFEIERQVAFIKANHGASLKTLVSDASKGSQRTFLGGIALLAGILPLSLVFARMIRAVNRQLTEASQRLSEASGKILNIAHDAQVSSRDLASTSQQQVASIEESAANISEMRAMLSQTVTHSETAMTTSGTCFREASDGTELVLKMRDAMAVIERSYNELENVNEIVQSIQEKTTVINDIVFKTQLLSFNASIEAARAGQHGRGFAVVAEEVGSLAKMSGTASLEIQKALESSTRSIAETIQNTKQKVNFANKLSQDCAKLFEGITERTGQTKQIVDYISQSAVEQDLGARSVSDSMAVLNTAAGDTNRMAINIAELSGLLKNESNALASTVENLNHLVVGATAAVDSTKELKKQSDSALDSAA